MNKPKNGQSNSDQTGQPARASRIPEFSSIQEEAEWWDTHSIVDYLDELEPVKIKFAKNLSSPIAVRLDASDRARLIQIAHEEGVGTSTLIRMWIKDRLRQQAS
jgi:hypothetical protein